MADALALTEEPPVLTAADRCDRCGAEAQRRFQLASGELLFCGHHSREYAAALAKAVLVPRAL